MELTKKQQEGLEIAVARYKEGCRWTTIAGYAGSGKSTLVKFIVSALNIPENKVAYVAFTGKAATVLKSKGCHNAITAHKLLYTTEVQPTGDYKFLPKEELDKEYQLIVIDEISMLPKVMWEQLLQHQIYVLALGDPEQLPPIDSYDDNHVLEQPHIFLDEIIRQAQESEIIRLSMHVRQGLPLNTFKAEGKQVQILSKNEIVSGMYDWADQILCATNELRTVINNTVRQSRGYGEEPAIGDKIISLKNHWEDFSLKGDWALTNGAIGTITNFKQKLIEVPYYISNFKIPYLFTNMELEDNDQFLNIPIDYQGLKTGKSFLNTRQEYLLNKNHRLINAPYDFAYAYAITCHKAQGSEWDKVLVFEEKFPFEEEEHRRWLYTACTRAKKKLVIIKKD